jgi:signal transduction histidine kinase
LRGSYERIRDLGGRLLLAQEEEAARLARELHDDICQQLGLSRSNSICRHGSRSAARQIGRLRVRWISRTARSKRA